VKDAGPKEAVSGEFEYLRVTSRQLREGTVAGLKYPADGAQGTDLGALNYLGGQGWDALFQGESETVICKRRVGDRTRWEYFVAKGSTGPDRADVMGPLLKEAGGKGWELSAVHEKGDVAIFKRPLPSIKQAEPKKEEQKPDGVKPTEGKEEQFEWKGEKRMRLVQAVDLGGEGVEFILLQPGKFDMGSPASDKEAWDSEKPQHRVTFTTSVWVGKYPVTKGQFAAFVKATGYKTQAEEDGVADGFDGKAVAFRAKAAGYSWKNTGWEQTDRHPVVNVTWNDAQKYCEWASKEAGRKVRLLTEAEYEYANRGGESTLYLSGDNAASLEGYANVGDLAREVKIKLFNAAPFDDGYAFTSPVGQFKPNGFGLYDTTGNVMSWCADCHDEKLYERGDVTDPNATVTPVPKAYVLRGGSWVCSPKRCRAAWRDAAAPSARSFEYGFRLAFDGPSGPKKEAPKAETKKDPPKPAEFPSMPVIK
jgi:formylglycine-generating enzyme required for sulfatase activity